MFIYQFIAGPRHAFTLKDVGTTDCYLTTTKQVPVKHVHFLACAVSATQSVSTTVAAEISTRPVENELHQMN